MTDVEIRAGNLYWNQGDAELMISSWPYIVAWRRPTGSQGWLPCGDPGIDLAFMRLAAEDACHTAWAIQEWLKTLPAHILAWVAAYPEGHWRLLQAFKHLGPLAATWATRGDFALLFMLAHLERFARMGRRFSWERAVDLASKPRQDVAGGLGFPCPDAAGILARVVPGTCAFRYLRRLKAMTRFPKLVARLAAFPRINVGLLTLVRDPERGRLCSPHLLEEVSLSVMNDSVAPSAWDIDTILDHDERTGRASRPPISGLAELEAIFREIREGGGPGGNKGGLI